MTEARPTAPLENRALLAEIARALVSDPIQVRVQEEQKNGAAILSLYVRPEDRGRIIGRHGRTITSIRQIFGLIGQAENCPIIVELVDE